jgi:hypothetical protein
MSNNSTRVFILKYKDEENNENNYSHKIRNICVFLN